ncbi:hypothetical protein NIES2109_62790 (plasmid) [Nostoc sp. HK-01]|nr:hypothetical protein NIES2109_62790 [Nostoc sp. HK-01]
MPSLLSFSSLHSTRLVITVKLSHYSVNMPKQIEATVLKSYASTRLSADEKAQIANIAAMSGKKQSVIIREAVRLYLDQSA